MNSRQVRATAAMEMNTYFMDMLGFASLTAPAAGTAIESVSDIEIMLVLDVSGSMGSDSKLTNLQDAAEEFVVSMFAEDVENRISIGIVPFNGQINLGPTLRARYNTIDQHGVANINCVDLPPAAFVTSDLSTTLPLPMTAAADTFSTTNTGNAYYAISSNTPNVNNTWCPPSTSNIVMPPTRNQGQLIGRINSFTAVGATSINAGVRWGIELMDPGSRPMFAQLISAGLVPSYFNDRPYDYNREDSLKVLVVMSDGENFPEERVNAGYRTGNSPIYQATSDSNMSIFHASQVNTTNATTICNSRPFWVPHRSQWQSRPWNGANPPNNACYVPNAPLAGATALAWQQVWAQVRVKWVAWQMYGRAFGGNNSGLRSQFYNQQLDEMRTYTDTGTMDDQLQDMCDMAQDNGVTVFTIAFQAPANGRDQLFDCASSPSHYFDAQGLEIRAAFRAIAAQINRLRLIE